MSNVLYFCSLKPFNTDPRTSTTSYHVYWLSLSPNYLEFFTFDYTASWSKTVSILTVPYIPVLMPRIPHIDEAFGIQQEAKGKWSFIGQEAVRSIEHSHSES